MGTSTLVLPDADPTLQAPLPATDPSLTAAIAALRRIATEPLTVERCMQLTGAGRGDVVLALRALEREVVVRDTAGKGMKRA